MNEIIRFFRANLDTEEYGTLENLNLSVFYGEMLLIVGERGSGKENIVEFLKGNINVSSGTFYLDESRCNEINHDMLWKSGIVCLESGLCLIDSMTIGENLLILQKRSFKQGFRSIGNIEVETNRILKETGMTFHAKDKVYSLTSIQQYCLCIIKEIVFGARLLILDVSNKAFSDYDYTELEKIIRLIRNKSISLLIIDGESTLLALTADRVVLLHHGTIGKTLYKRDIENRSGGAFLTRSTPFLPLANLQTDRLKREGFEEKTDCCTLQYGDIMGVYDVFEGSDVTIDTPIKLRFPDSDPILLMRGPFVYDRKTRTVFIPRDSGAQLFEMLTLEENLLMPVYKRASFWSGVISRRAAKHCKREFLRCFSIDGDPASVVELSTLERRLLSIYRWVLDRPALIWLECYDFGLNTEESARLLAYLHQLSNDGIMIVVSASKLAVLKENTQTLLVFQHGEFVEIRQA